MVRQSSEPYIREIFLGLQPHCFPGDASIGRPLRGVQKPTLDGTHNNEKRTTHFYGID